METTSPNANTHKENGQTLFETLVGYTLLYAGTLVEYSCETLPCEALGTLLSGTLVGVGRTTQASRPPSEVANLYFWGA